MNNWGQKKKTSMETFFFVIPCLILVGIMVYTPFVMSMYYSLTEWNGIAKEPIFVGFDNFISLFMGNKSFMNALIFTGKYTILFMIFANIAALILAVVLTQPLKTANILRGIFFVPYIMSMIIVGFIWRFIFSQGFASLTKITGWAVFELSWLGETKLAFISIVIVSIWQAVGFYIVIYIAGLQAIPDDVIEAAKVDGASPMRTFFSVTLPLLGPAITTCIFMSLTNSIKVFDIILALTAGGPGGTTYSATLDIYREAFQNNNYGLGAAKSLTLFVIVLGITGVVLKSFKKREVEM